MQDYGGNFVQLVNSVPHPHDADFCNHTTASNPNRFPSTSHRYGISLQNHAGAAPAYGAVSTIRLFQSFAYRQQNGDLNGSNV